MYGHSPDAEKQEVRQNLHSLLCSQAISKNGFDAVEASLSHEWVRLHADIYSSCLSRHRRCVRSGSQRQPKSYGLLCWQILSYPTTPH